MKLANHFEMNKRMYSVEFEWLPAEAPEPDEDMNEEEREDLALCIKEPCSCGMVHGFWESETTNVLVRGSANRAGELVQTWVMSDAFTELNGEALGVRTINISFIGEAMLTPESLGLPE